MLLKLLLALILATTAVIVAGLSGILFKFWPTGWADAELRVSSTQVERLVALRREPKFLADPKLFYPGAPNEPTRIALEEILNGTIDHITQGVQRTPRKSFLLSTFKQVLARADQLDSEEKDRLLLYFNDIMEILGLHSSNELLNVWRYGFPYGWFKIGT